MTDLSVVPVSPRAFLARHPPFDSLRPEALDRVEDALEIRFAAEGERLIERGGAPSDALWIIRKGRVRLEREGEALELFEAGDCFGYPSLLGSRPPLRDAIVTEEALLFRLPEREFRRLLDEPGAARFFLEGLASRLRLHGSGAPGESSTSLAPASTLGRRPLATVDPSTSVELAARRMRELGVGSLLVSREEVRAEGGLPIQSILGIVTDRDLRDRIVAAGRPTSTPVGEIATSPLVTLAAGASSADALLAFARHGVRHLPLVSDDRVVGLLSASDLMLQRSLDPLALRRELELRPLAELLPGFTDRLRRVVAELSAAGVDALAIGPIVSALADQLARRLYEEACAAEALAPGDAAWLVHGSEGRQEQILPTDQDNALAFRDGGAAEPWSRVAKRVVDGLLAAGYPPCPGGYMATRWHDPLAAWIHRFERWIVEPREEDGVDIHTFLDLRGTAGGLDLAALEETMLAAGRDRHFLRALAREIGGWALPFGLFGALKEGEEGFDLKRGSLLIVAIARLAALEAQSPARGTLDRLVAAEPILGEDAATLAEGFRYLASLRLELALDPARRAEAASGHRIHLASLNALERRFLKDIFGLLKQVRDGIVARFAL